MKEEYDELQKPSTRQISHAEHTIRAPSMHWSYFTLLLYNGKTPFHPSERTWHNIHTWTLSKRAHAIWIPPKGEWMSTVSASIRFDPTNASHPQDLVCRKCSSARGNRGLLCTKVPFPSTYQDIAGRGIVERTSISIPPRFYVVADIHSNDNSIDRLIEDNTANCSVRSRDLGHYVIIAEKSLELVIPSQW